MRSQALLFSQGNERQAAWEEALFRGLGDKSGDYEKVSSRCGGQADDSSLSRNMLV